MRKSIETKYMPASAKLGARIVSQGLDAGRMVTHWDHDLGVEQNHAAAAKSYAQRMGWNGVWVAGGTKAGNVYVNVCDAAVSEVRDVLTYGGDERGDWFLVD